MAAVLFCTSFAEPADLAKIERKIAKELAYQSEAPRYCLLVFGPEAKTRVWLVQDGDVLYVDRNGNGDLTEAGKRVALPQGDKNYKSFEAGDIQDGSLSHTGLVVTQVRASPESIGDPKEFARIKSQNTEPWYWTVRVSAERPANDTRSLPKRIGYIANGDGLGYLLFAARPQDAPIIHFNGPWTLGLQDTRQRLIIGQRSNLQIGVGAQGIGPGTFSFVRYPDTIATHLDPVAEIAFPPKSPDQPRITKKFTLTHRC
jgi:hypothetical protein